MSRQSRDAKGQGGISRVPPRARLGSTCSGAPQPCDSGSCVRVAMVWPPCDSENCSIRITCSTVPKRTIGFCVARKRSTRPRAPLTSPFAASSVLVRMTCAPALSLSSAGAAALLRSCARLASSLPVSRARKVLISPGSSARQAVLIRSQSLTCEQRRVAAPTPSSSGSVRRRQPCSRRRV